MRAQMDKTSAGYTTPGFPRQANVNHLETVLSRYRDSCRGCNNPTGAWRDGV